MGPPTTRGLDPKTPENLMILAAAAAAADDDDDDDDVNACALHHSGVWPVRVSARASVDDALFRADFCERCARTIFPLIFAQCFALLLMRMLLSLPPSLS
eukprot:9501158-Pyramimonas_sp.AAC.4